MTVQPQPFRFGAVVLAAGASTRMGEPKQLLRLGGRTLLRRTIDTAFASSAWPVVVVLGANADLIRPEVVRLPVLVVDNPEWQEGLAASIRAGMRVVDSFSLSLQAALLLLCDQPNLSPAIINQITDTHRRTGKSIVAAMYDHRPGSPALFARRHFHELTELQGPSGAKPLFARHADSLATVPLPELAADIDTPEDFAAAQQSL